MQTENQTEILFEFQPADQATLDQLNETFNDEEILHSSGFDGTLLVAVITASATLIRALFMFYKAHKDALKSAKIKIKNKEISIEGFSADEINDMVEKGTLQQLLEKLK
jgi:hypothetical protein